MKSDPARKVGFLLTYAICYSRKQQLHAFCMFVRPGCAGRAQLWAHFVPSFIVNERTKGTTVTPQGPKEEHVAAYVSMTERMISTQEKKIQNEETKDNQRVFFCKQTMKLGYPLLFIHDFN